MSESVPSESIRVFLLIENRLLREALVRLLRKRPDLTIVGESGETDQTIQDILETNCDVLVIGAFQSNWLLPGFTHERVEELGFKTVSIDVDANEVRFIATVRPGVTGY